MYAYVVSGCGVELGLERFEWRWWRRLGDDASLVRS